MGPLLETPPRVGVPLAEVCACSCDLLLGSDPFIPDSLPDEDEEPLDVSVITVLVLSPSLTKPGSSAAPPVAAVVNSVFAMLL